MRPRLLYLVNDADFFVSHRLALGVQAVGLGVDVAVAAPDAGGRTTIERAGIRFLPLPLARSSTRPSDEARTIAAIRRIFVKEKPSLVHSVTIKPVIYGGLLARALGVPALVSSISGLGYVFMARGRRADLRRAMVEGLYRRALAHPRSRVIFQNEADREAMVSRGLLGRERAVLLPGGSGVDLAAFDPRPPITPPMVLLPARMLRDKGVTEFVEAARSLRRAGVAARFVLAGAIDEGNPTGLSPAELAAATSDGAVEWWGHQADMPSVLAQAHIVCLPSYREGMPKALLEAAAAARAVVTTDVPGCRDAIIPGDTGLLVPVRDAGALRRTLGELLADPQRVLALGQGGRKFAEAALGIDRVVKGVFDVYRAVAPPELMVALGQRDA